MLGMPKNNEPIKGEFAEKLVKELLNRGRKRPKIITLQPYKLGDKFIYDFWFIPEIRYSNGYDKTLRISWLFWGIQIFF